MALRRFLLSPSFSRKTTSSWRPPHALSCVTTSSFPLSTNSQNKQQTHYPPPQLISIRSFSAVDDRSYRERARDGAQAARKRAHEARTKGTKAARSGAKTAREMISQYGPVFIGTYMSVYFISWGLLFVGMDSGLLDPVQIMGYIGGGAEEGKSTVHVVVEYMEKYSWTKPYAETVEKNPHIANLAVAWVTNKFTEPARLLFTMAVVPRLARHFGFVHALQEEEHVDEKDEKEPIEKEEAVHMTKDAENDETMKEKTMK